MLSLLTKYLLQYRRIAIPHVGTFELVPQSAEFNVVDQLMLPPSFHLNWSNNDLLSDHQLSYLAASIRSDKEKVRKELDAFGQGFKTKVQGKPFNWAGIGTINQNSGYIGVDTNLLQVEGLESVTAQKLLRPNADHNMLVGDRQTTSHQMSHSLSQPGKKKSYVVMIGWILFFLTLLAIIFLLYKNGFNPLASGLK